MKRFKIGQSTADIVSQSGLALIGQAINRYTTLTQELDTQVPLRCPHTPAMLRKPPRHAARSRSIQKCL